MRLRDILFLVNESLPKINAIGFVQPGNNAGYRITNIKGIHYYFKRLSEIEALKNDIQQLLARHAYLISEQEFMTVNYETYTECKDLLEFIRLKGTMISELLTQVIQSQCENTISFKLYKFEDFFAFSDFCSDLKKILVPLKLLKIDIQLGELEVGSEWISVIFGTGLGLIFFTAIIRQTFDILIHDYQKLKVAKAVTKSLQLGNELLENYNKKIFEKMEKIKFDKADQIVNEIKESDDFPLTDTGELSELRSSIKLSMDCLEKHIDKGLEIYQALDKKEDERFKLPDFTKLLELKQPQKLLTDKVENDATD